MHHNINILAGVIAILAGLYLAMLKSAGANSLIESLANGVGWYIVARGLYMISSSFESKAMHEQLNRQTP